MSALLVGYARCSTDQQDLTAQRDGLLALGVDAERIYVGFVCQREERLSISLGSGLGRRGSEMSMTDESVRRFDAVPGSAT